MVEVEDEVAVGEEEEVEEDMVELEDVVVDREEDEVVDGRRMRWRTRQRRREHN